MTDRLNLNPLRFFVEVVEQGGFTSAAASLKVAKTLVSRQIARLEATIGTTLLIRTTRRVEPTEAGRRLYARAKSLLSELDEVYEAAAETGAEPGGTLTLTAPHDYGTAVVVPALAAFLQRYPECAASLRSDDQVVDLSRGELDLSIRLGWLEDSPNTAQRIGRFRQIAVCHPSVGRGQGEMGQPGDLARLPFIANMALLQPSRWTFTQGGQETTVTLTPALSVDTTQAALRAALSGAGVCVLPDFVVARHVAATRLIHLVPSWVLPEGGVYLVYPPGRYRPSRVPAFVTVLLEQHRAIMGR